MTCCIQKPIEAWLFITGFVFLVLHILIFYLLISTFYSVNTYRRGYSLAVCNCQFFSSGLGYWTFSHALSIIKLFFFEFGISGHSKIILVELAEACKSHAILAFYLIEFWRWKWHSNEKSEGGEVDQYIAKFLLEFSCFDCSGRFYFCLTFAE